MIPVAYQSKSNEKCNYCGKLGRLHDVVQAYQCWKASRKEYY